MITWWKYNESNLPAAMMRFVKDFQAEPIMHAQSEKGNWTFQVSMLKIWSFHFCSQLIFVFIIRFYAVTQLICWLLFFSCKWRHLLFNVENFVQL